MADNLGYTPGSGATVSTEEVTTLNGGAVSAQHLQRMVPCIATAAATAVDVPGDATNGIDVDVTRVSGNVTVVQSTASNLLAQVSGTVAVSSLPTLPAGTNYIGKTRITDGTNDLTVDTVHGDAESATENHIDVQARLSGVNAAGTFDMVRANTTVFKGATYATAQTGTALWTPAAGKAICITSLQIQSFGTTAGTCAVWFGATADTTFTRGTDASIFDGEFAPSATNKPGVYVTFPTPCRGTADYVLRVTTTNAQSVNITVWGFEI
jgi:hypothetical protein